MIDKLIDFFITGIYQVRFGAILVLGPANIYLAIRVARDFGYLAFRTVGAAEAIHST